MPSSKKKKQGDTTDSPQASTSRDGTGVEEDVSETIRPRSRFASLELADEVQTNSLPYVTEDKIQEMFVNLQAGLLLTLREELDKRDKRQPTISRPTTPQGATTNEPQKSESSSEEGESSVSSSDDERRSSASRKSTLSSSKIVQTIYEAIPKYDGEGDVQKLLDFADKVDDYVNTVDMAPTTMVTMITTKLTGTASLLWRHHKKNVDVSSPLRIRDWKGLHDLLFRCKVTEEHERQILAQLDTIQQKGSVKEYNIAFDKLTMQMSDLPERFEKHYYLKGLRKEIRQLVESNKDNLDNMMTLKAACLRQDNISNPSLGNKKVGDDAGGTTALNMSSNGERHKGK